MNISMLISIIKSEVVSIIASIMIRIIFFLNVKTLIININTISRIRTSSMIDIQNNIIMVRYNGKAVMMTMYIL